MKSSEIVHTNLPLYRNLCKINTPETERKIGQHEEVSLPMNVQILGMISAVFCHTLRIFRKLIVIHHLRVMLFRCNSSGSVSDSFRFLI